MTSVAFGPEEYEDPERRKEIENIMDKSKLELMLGLAMQIGIEQGARMNFQDTSRSAQTSVEKIIFEETYKYLKNKVNRDSTEDGILICLEHRKMFLEK